MQKVEAKKKIAKLVEKYRVLTPAQIKKYTEAETCKDFILPFFNALGWDIEDKTEVTAEENTSAKDRSDYGFYLNGWPKFYLEAKKLKANIDDEKFAKQATSYSWNKGITWAILTDFESLIVFNAQDIAEHLSHKLFLRFNFDEYLDKFDKLWWLSKESFKQNVLDKEAEAVGKKLQRVSVTETLYKDLNDCRELLLKSFHTWNKDKPYDLLDEGVQKLLDRLIFIRVAEDRELEQPTLIPMVRAAGGSNSEEFFKNLVAKFREMDKVYNSNLFQPHPFENWEEYDGATAKVIDILHGKKGYYEYNFQVMPADILGSVYENYLGYRLAQSTKGLEVSKDARKRREQGIYYTPTYIVDYIVANTLKPLLDNCESVEDLKSIKVLDPACGSGSFLIKAHEMIYEKYLEFGASPGEMTKTTILLDNIFGVDLDEQAVEIARLNLLLTILDSRGLLPDLSKNIKNGNSLIFGTDKELESFFGKNFRDKKPFNWHEEFTKVFSRERPGFDVIIGNPPYGISFNENEKSYLANFDPSVPDFEIYIYFISLGLSLLRKQGLLSYIFPNTFLVNLYARKYRQKILETSQILSIADLSESSVFTGASVRTCIMTISKTLPVKRTKFIKEQEGIFDSNNAPSYAVDLLSKNINNWLNLAYANDIQQNIIDKIKASPITVNTYFYVSQGLIPYDKYRGHDEETIKNRIWHSDYKKDETYRKELKGGDIDRYQVTWNGKTWISYGKWLAAPRDKKFFTSKRLLIREITNERGLLAAYSENEYYNTPSIINVVAREKENDQYLLSLLSILNSKLGSWFHKHSSPKARKGLFPKVLVDDIRKFPLGDSFKDYSGELAVLAKKQLAQFNELKLQTLNSNQWISAKSEIDKTDSRIDQLVYKLYNLTQKEIEIIERANGN